jgi:hypothetical protein
VPQGENVTVGRRGCSIPLVILKGKENQHQSYARDEPECGLLAVPGLGLPHLEPLTAYDHEAKEPKSEAGHEAGYGRGLGGIECKAAPLARLP